MELEVSQKVRAAIKAKLVELSVHVDEELPDYIMVLIANRRSAPQMESDLNLFLGEQTHRFVTWLTHVLKKLEEVTAAATITSAPPPPQQQQQSTAKKRKSSGGGGGSGGDASGSDGKKEDTTQQQQSKKKKREKLVDNKSEEEEKQQSPVRGRTPDNNEEDLSKMRSELLKSAIKHKKSIDSNESASPSQTQKESPRQRTRSSSSRKGGSPTPPRSKVSTPPRSRERSPPPRKQSRSPIRSRPSPPQRSMSRESPPPRSTRHSPPPRTKVVSPPQQRSRRDSHTTRAAAAAATSPPKQRRSRSRSPIQLVRRRDHIWNSGTGRPMSSVFQRLLTRRTRNAEPRSRSNSPPSRTQNRLSPSPPPRPQRVLSSVVVRKNIESFIKSNNEPPPYRPQTRIASAVVKIEQPKTRSTVEKPSKLLLKAVTEANADAFRERGKEAGKKQEVVNKIERRLETISSRKKSPPPSTKQLLQQPTPPPFEERRSVHQRLGKRIVMKKSIHERLGSRGFMENIIVRVEGDADEVFEQQRHDEFVEEEAHPFVDSPHALPSPPEVHMPRISIAVNDDDTSDESDVDEEDRVEPASHDDSSSKQSFSDEKGQDSASPAQKQSPTHNDDDDDEEDDDDEDMIVLQSPSDLELMNDKPDSVCSSRQEEKSVDEELCTPHTPQPEPIITPRPTSDLREKLVKQHNARKLQQKKEEQERKAKEAAGGGPPPLPPPSQPQGLTKPPPTTVIINPISVQKHASVTPPALTISSSSSSSSSQQCKYWPKCTFKDKCVYSHPPCKFNPCTNSSCAYKHAVKKNVAVVAPALSALPPSSSRMNAGTCKFFPKCHNLECKFFHPTPCRFGLGCRDKSCKFFHPGGGVGGGSGNVIGAPAGLPNRNLLKWEKKV